jgi:hypothetical protein
MGVRLLLIVLLAVTGCSKPVSDGTYGYITNGSSFLGGVHPEHWTFTNAPSFRNRDWDRMQSVNACLTALGMTPVTNAGVLSGRVGQLIGGWVFYDWPDYPRGLLQIRFAESPEGRLQVDVVFKPGANKALQ